MEPIVRLCLNALLVTLNPTKIMSDIPTKVIFPISTEKNRIRTRCLCCLHPGGSFIKDSTCNGEVTKDESSQVEGKKIYARNTIPSSTYIIEMSGRLGFSSGTETPATWGAYVRNKYFWIEPTEKIVAEGTAVTITANGVSAESTWTVNNKVWKDWRDPNSSPYKTSSISLNRDMWDKLEWTPENSLSNWLCPPAGRYNILATTTELSPGSRSASAIIYVINIGNIHFKKARMGTYREIDQPYKMIGIYTNETCSFFQKIDPSSVPLERISISWSGILNGNNIEISGNISASGSQNSNLYGKSRSASVVAISQPAGISDAAFAFIYYASALVANQHNLITLDIRDNIAYQWAIEAYPNEAQHNGKGDAVRHAYWSCLLSRYCGDFFAEGIGTGHESGALYETEAIMDLHNNAIGRQLSNHVHGADESCCKNAVNNALITGSLWYLDSSYNQTDTTGSALLQPTNK